MKDGTKRESVKYAYLGNSLHDAAPRIKGHAAVQEMVEKRTSHSRTYATPDGKRVTEIVAGAPQYYKDPEGKWWQVEYATTTAPEFETLKKAPEFQGPSAFDWLRTAFADIGTFYPEADPETASFDGSAEYNPGFGGGSWDTSRDATVASGYSDSNTNGWTITGRNGGDTGFVIDRLFLGFDTSAIEDGSTIDAATTSLWALSSGVQDDDGNDFVALVHPAPASNSALAAGDFDSFAGLTGAMTEGSGRIDISSGVAIGAYNHFVLNATGRSWISPTGTSWLGVAEGHDILDDPFGVTGANFHNGVLWSTAEESGTSQDPKLTVTYTPPNIAPIAPTLLWTEGTATPAFISTTTPRFSAIYNDPNAGDQAPYFRIQVAATTSFATGTLLWDSGKTGMATTSVGSRSPDITYAGGTPLMFNGTTYHWRIKFWDAADAEGAWSNPTQFTMGAICAP